MKKGILFDMDGVLVDSEEYILKAAMGFFAELGVTTVPEDFIPFVGAGENRYIGGVAEKYGIEIEIDSAKKRTYEIYDDLCRNNLPPMEGVLDFVAWCREKNLKLALATSADETKMLINLREIGLPPSTFDVMINGLQVKHKKPFPDIYEAAAYGVGLSPSDCIVIEDAVNGVQAGKAAGAYCVGITSSFSADELEKAGADRVVNSLQELTGDDNLLAGD